MSLEVWVGIYYGERGEINGLLGDWGEVIDDIFVEEEYGCSFSLGSLIW